MNQSSVAKALGVQPEVPYRLFWQSQGVVHIQLSEPLAVGTRYQFTIDTTATDTHGIALDETYRWNYWLEDIKANLSEAYIERGVTRLKLEFNYNVDAESVETSVRFEPTFDAKFRWNSRSAPRSATLTIEEPLAPDAEYTLLFTSPIKDTNDVEIGTPKQVSFRSPPPILSLYPEPGDMTTQSETIEVHFDRAMDHESAEGAFNIAPALPGHFSWDGNKMIYHLERVMERTTDYRLTINPTAKDSNGVTVFNRPFTWSFTSTYSVPHASFGEWGSKIQLVDADGLRAVQFALGRSEPTRIFFTLHELSIRQFVQLTREDPIFIQPDLANVSGEPDLVQTWEITSGLPREHWNLKQVYIPKDVPPGLYMLSMKIDGVLQDQLLLVLSSNTLTVKRAGKNLLVWVTDIHGEALPDTEVRVYTTEGLKIREAHTDDDGIYETSVPPDHEPLLVVARTGENDITAAGVNKTWLNASDYWSWWRPSRLPVVDTYIAYVYTDRPIYRPGQTVQYKAILRQDDDVDYTLPPVNTPVEVRIRDARRNVLQTSEAATNILGTIHGEVTLAEGASLGVYSIELTLAGETHEGHFKVQDYRKPDIRIDVTADAKTCIAGDNVTLNVDAQYLFGEPVKNAEITIREYDLGEFYGYWGDGERVADRDQYVWYPRYKSERQARTDSNGHYSTNLTASISWEEYQNRLWGTNLTYSTWGIEVTIDDGSHQTVSNFVVVKVFSAAETVSLVTDSYLYDPGAVVRAKAQVATISDQPVPDRALKLEIRQYNRRRFRYETTGDIFEAVTDENGVASIPLTFESEGHYILELTSKDERGNEVRTSRHIAVYEIHNRWTRYSANEDLTIWAEKESYRPYQVASLFIESSFGGPAILTFERGKVHRVKEIELTPPLTRLEVPIHPSDVPNIFITVNAWQAKSTTIGEHAYLNLPESRLRTANVELAVDPQGKNLNVEIEPDRSIFNPREEARITIRVKDSNFKPVRAEVSLALVDEGIYGLSEEFTDPILEAFYGPREHAVLTYDSMSPWREIYAVGRGGGGGDGGNIPGNPRSDFPDTAAWFPVLTTDRNGEVTVTLNLPDSLTSWRLTARAVTADTLVGEAKANIQTHLPIIVRPILPRSLTAGDQLTLATFVQNTSEVAHDVEISLKSDQFEITDPSTQSITLTAGESTVVGWSVVAGGAGEAEVEFRADAGEVGDAVRLSLPIRPLSVPEVVTQVGAMEDEFVTAFFLPEDALDTSTVHVELNRSIAGNLLSGLEFLTGFPYGCVEQIMSKALPNAVVGRALIQSGASDPALRNDLKPKILAGLQQLYAMQHQDGGWGWWYDDRSHAYQTAWVVFGLAITEEAGYEVDPEVIERGVSWLTENFEAMDLRTQAFSLYSMVMAGSGDLEATMALYAQGMTLDTFSQAALAITLSELGAHDEAESIIEKLEGDMLVSGEGAFWPSTHEDGHYRQKTMASSTRSTAIALSAFSRIDPENELIPEIVSWLIAKRRTQGWGTTNETAFTVLALSDYILSMQEARGQTSFIVELNGRPITSGVLDQENPTLDLELDTTQMVKGLNELRIQESGDVQLYYVISNYTLLPRMEIDSAGSIQVNRTYRDANKHKAISQAEAGQLVEVVLEVTVPEDSFYLIVEDNLPGGLEALNESLNSASHVVNEFGEAQLYWRDRGYNYKEVHGDRVSFFITELGQGKHTYSYLARATHHGSFIATPAVAWEMYDLSMWGRSASNVLSVSEADERQPARVPQDAVVSADE